MVTEAFDFLISWFVAHCDGDWEHDLGVRIATMDNPGWSLDVSLEGTELADRPREWERMDNGVHWLHWRATPDTFEARCGPEDLALAVEAFQSFACST